ncbi:zinc ribbon domain-containing protein [Mycobacterium sp.]|uniref:zinc ribbon domain-containing protein n=1 Tax=Mycobacterium sp. TaxID=1785 RepID=UPI003F988343
MSLETAILLWLFCAAIGAAIAKSKNRNWTEGLLLGGLLGVIGVIIELFLRAQSPGLPLSGWYPDPAGTGSQRYWNGREWSDLPPRPNGEPRPQAVDGLAAVQAQTKKCPDCAETILVDAKICRYCGHHFPTTNARCFKCNHVQAVLTSETEFTCEQCGQHLKRHTAPPAAGN